MRGIPKIEAFQIGTEYDRPAFKTHTQPILPFFLPFFLSRMSSSNDTPPALGPAPASDDHDHSQCGESCSLRPRVYTWNRPILRPATVDNIQELERAMAIVGDALNAPYESTDRRKLLQNAISAFSALTSDLARMYIRMCRDILNIEYGI